ncbi:MAG: hypothetical protein ONB13_10555 [candidate division KSB1 bacterium]|nr:hypothetical protein [candidate division KSB1 bacterium]MDZ7336410.1 hypothetical protein [candidate division KSB1 bacterium]MDZ7358413.1 hypothetical protein [candidate division KSB1 bacterium]MDZ7377050.1 hypothetical protein [candidate division KSB1 bacterium]MDZ7401904.1 hypothetical protein [candidate division KSB1 bacterium]
MINLKISHYKLALWILAFVITISSAVYQRLTGPTYPKRGHIQFINNRISYKLIRSQNVNTDIPIALTVPDSSISGYVSFKRYKSNDDWSTLPLRREQAKLVGAIPHRNQAPAGKLMYYVYLTRGDQKVSLTGEEPIVLRFKGPVPAWVLLPHVLIMFLAMLFSNRAGLEALDARGSAYKYLRWTIGLFFIGGFILGPLVQKYAFGALWTGWPFGQDLTDNKTLIAMLGWLLAWYKNRRGREGRGWIIFAAFLMLAAYLIPHSMFGSEIDYSKLGE